MAKRLRNPKHPGCWFEKPVLYCRFKHPDTGKDTIAKFKAIPQAKPTKKLWEACYKYRLQLADGDILSPQDQRELEKKAAGLTIEVLANNYFNHEDEETGVRNQDKAIHRTDKPNLKRLVAYFGSQDITKAAKSDVKGFATYCAGLRKENDQPFSQQSRKHMMGLLQRVLNFNDILFSTVFWKQVIPQVSKRRHKKGFLTAEEMATLRHTLDTYPHNPEVVRMMRLFMTWGCRCSELTRLRWKFVDLKAKTVLFVDRKNGAPDLMLGMDAEIQQVFREQRGGTLPMPETLVFPGKGGSIRKSQSVSRAARSILNKAGIDKSFKPTHGFRNNTAFYVNQQADLETAGKVLGHTSTRTTKGYIETIEDGHVAAVNIMTAVKEG